MTDGSDESDMVELPPGEIEAVCNGAYGPSGLVAFQHPNGDTVYAFTGAPMTREDLVFFLGGILQDLATEEESRDLGIF